MDAPKKMIRIVGGLRYSIDASTLIAHDRYWDGSNQERGGRNTYLYLTPRGRFFTVTLTQWQGERDKLTPITKEEAMDLYEGPLTEHVISYEAAFDVEVKDA